MVNSINPYRIEGQKTGRLRDRRRAGRRARRPLHPGGQRRQHHRLLAGLPGVQGGRAQPTQLPRMMGFQAAGAAPIVPGTRSSTPRPSPPPSGSATRPAGTSARGRDRVRRRHRHGHRRGDPGRLPLPGRRGIGVLRAGVGRLGGRPAQAWRARRPRPGSTVVCVLTGHGLKDPDLAISQIRVPTWWTPTSTPYSDALKIWSRSDPRRPARVHRARIVAARAAGLCMLGPPSPPQRRPFGPPGGALLDRRSRPARARRRGEIHQGSVRGFPPPHPPYSLAVGCHPPANEDMLKRGSR